MPESSLAITPKHLAVTDEQLKLAKETVASKLNEHEFDLFLYNCQRQGIHPLDHMLIPVVRTDNGVRRLTFTTTVDLLRSRAAESGEYAGSDDAVFTEDGRLPKQATVTVWRIVQSVRCPFTATARWDEYVPSGDQAFMWKNKPHVMLAKCAEALALRKAFPKQLAGMYAAEEMHGPDRTESVEEKKTRKEVERATLEPGKEPNRGHGKEVIEAEVVATNPAPEPKKKADKAEKPKDLKTIEVKVLDVKPKMKKSTGKPPQDYYILECEGDVTLFVWDKHCHAASIKSKGRKAEFAVSESNGYTNVQDVLSVDGVKFTRDPETKDCIPAELLELTTMKTTPAPAPKVGLNSLIGKVELYDDTDSVDGKPLTTKNGTKYVAINIAGLEANPKAEPNNRFYCHQESLFAKLKAATGKSIEFEYSSKKDAKGNVWQAIEAIR